MTLVWKSWTPDLVIKRVANNAEGLLEDTCQFLVNKIKSKMLENKSGIVYSLGGGQEYQASAPYESPAHRFGVLYDNVEYKIKRSADKLFGIIGVNLDGDGIGYAYFLGVGTRNMAIRPYLRKTMFEHEDDIKKILGI